MPAIISRSYFLSHLIKQNMNSDQVKHGTEGKKNGKEA